MVRKYIIYDKKDVTYVSIEGLLEEINKAVTKYGIKNVQFEVENEYYYSDTPTCRAYLICQRPMNEEEKTAAISKEQELEREQAAYRRRQYAALKKEFGK